MEKVLIVVDMQKGFMTHANYIDLSKKIENLLKNNMYTKIILTKFVNKENSFFVSKLNWRELLTEDSQKFSINIPQDNVEIFEKTSYGLTDKQLQLLKSFNVSSIDICGLKTDACVLAIALQLFDNNIFPNILINYCQTSLERNQLAKKMLIYRFGKVDEK